MEEGMVAWTIARIGQSLLREKTANVAAAATPLRLFVEVPLLVPPLVLPMLLLPPELMKEVLAYSLSAWDSFLSVS